VVWSTSSEKMLFKVAKPLEKEEFLQLYHSVSFLTKILFAPFGLHDQLVELLGKRTFLETYSLIYQQIEDVLSKAIFRIHGYDDDQIVATMHKFVGQSQDKQVRKRVVLLLFIFFLFCFCGFFSSSDLLCCP
jgi:hypothetical protein